MTTSFKLNGKPVTAQSQPDTPLLWVLRDELGLTGTKYGCGSRSAVPAPSMSKAVRGVHA